LPPISVSSPDGSEAQGIGFVGGEKIDGSSSQVVPLLVQQRYGRGQTLALTATTRGGGACAWIRKHGPRDVLATNAAFLVSGTPLQTEVIQNRTFMR
jgi:hypothetical protein